MSVNLAVERLYEEVELVRGTGNRHRGELCIMSFVAYLAGEPHTDSPSNPCGRTHTISSPVCRYRKRTPRMFPLRHLTSQS